MKYFVKNIIKSPVAEGKEKGEKVLEILYKKLSLKDSEKVIISFKDVEKIDVEFLNNSLGTLFKTMDKDYLFSNLRISDIKSKQELMLIKLVISLAVTLK